MDASVYIPTPFIKFTDGHSNVIVNEKNIQDALEFLINRHKQLKELIFDIDGQIPNHINIYLNNTEISSLNGTKTLLNDGDQIAIIPALIGG